MVKGRIPGCHGLRSFEWDNGYDFHDTYDSFTSIGPYP